jgi:hypothetical protein
MPKVVPITTTASASPIAPRQLSELRQRLADAKLPEDREAVIDDLAYQLFTAARAACKAIIAENSTAKVADRKVVPKVPTLDELRIVALAMLTPPPEQTQTSAATETAPTNPN